MGEARVTVRLPALVLVTPALELLGPPAKEDHAPPTTTGDPSVSGR